MTDVLTLAAKTAEKTSAGPTTFTALREHVTINLGSDKAPRLMLAQLCARDSDELPHVLYAPTDTPHATPCAAVNVRNVRRHEIDSALRADDKRDDDDSDKLTDETRSALTDERKSLSKLGDVDRADRVALTLLAYSAADESAAA